MGHPDSIITADPWTIVPTKPRTFFPVDQDQTPEFKDQLHNSMLEICVFNCMCKDPLELNADFWLPEISASASLTLWTILNYDIVVEKYS